MTSAEATALGGVIRRRRIGRNITQEELGKRAGYKSGAGVSISRIESGTVKPTPEKLRGIAKALNTTVEALEREAGIVHPKPSSSVQGQSIKARKKAVEVQILQRAEILSQVGAAYFGAVNRSVADMATPFITVCQEFANLPSTLEGATSVPETSEDPAQRVLWLKEQFEWALASDATVWVEALGPGVGAITASSGALKKVGQRSARSLFTAVSNLGRASTGVPTKELRGIARRNATMAQLGGGPRAAGGWGIAGGKAVLAAVAALPTAIVVGGVFASGLVNGRREQEAKVTAAEEFLARTEERFEAVITHMKESTEILEIVTVHGSWSFEAWQESLASPSGKPVREWSGLDELQQARYRKLMHVTACLTALLVLAPEELLTAPSARLPMIGELTFGDGQTTKQADETTSGTLGTDAAEASVDMELPLAAFEELQERYREIRNYTRKEIRASLGRRS
ncbi:helix-turn-helix domain-containing protein [Actinomadura geliboluensis]|uniref:Helix-turn-helix domain-containing protein n=1 Tax=Actinomadura geliboluensis TaxID=882440 RepID=A0A5S4GQE6_9ACTN|nr:helix-turn-helix transcriptional regulator [Actinomadura geliboluensis]TMR34982.1 helix-turn-helix domain-containing protein [Actinomadura geliboluensis]